MTGAELIEAERERQVLDENWTAEHDDEHVEFELSRAAICYVEAAQDRKYGGVLTSKMLVAPGWPWYWGWWKPSDDPVRNLVKAGALIAAEIDRLQRLPC